MTVQIGIIGGSGLYQMEGLKVLDQLNVATPFGDPSGSMVIGELGGREIAFLPRHGIGHQLPPHAINMRANIHAFKSLGVEWLISVNAVGSLREEIAPRHIVIPDQLVDFTRHRISTFFNEEFAVHVSMADPFCPLLRSILTASAEHVGAHTHPTGTYVCMEGPQFSSRAESEMYRTLGFDVIGMTAAPEAKLAREAELCYASLSCSTDYDCWHEEEEDVTAEMILQILRDNVATAQAIVSKAVRRLPPTHDCSCGSALEFALATYPDAISDTARRQFSLLIGKYVPVGEDMPVGEDVNE